jgi:hypothetical protein
MFAFEVTSTWVTFGPLLRLLRSVEGVADVRRNWFKDDRLSFTFCGQPCVVNEPWGDSSRYWVGPRDVESSGLDMTPVERVFRNHQGWIAQVLKRVGRAR